MIIIIIIIIIINNTIKVFVNFFFSKRIRFTIKIKEKIEIRRVFTAFTETIIMSILLRNRKEGYKIRKNNKFIERTTSTEDNLIIRSNTRERNKAFLKVF